MSRKLERRGFLKESLAAATTTTGAAWSATARGAAKTAKKAAASAEGLSAYLLDHQLWIRWDNQALTTYRAHATQKYPWFYPLAGPLTGLSLTSESSLPWPHHRSLFFGCDRVNGGNYWQDDIARGQIVSTNLRLGECTPKSVEILDRCEWRQPGQSPIAIDDRRFVVEAAGPKLRWIDARIVLKAVADVSIEKTNHSLFSVRAAEDITPSGGGHLRNAEGQTGEDGTFGKPAGWCTFYGKRKGMPEDVVEGIALFDHPSNPWKECPWFTRDYGFMSPTPLNFLESPYQLPAGKSLKLAYRVVMYAGTPEDARLSELYAAYAGG